MLARCKILFLLLALALSSPLGWIMEGPSHSGSKCNGMCCPKGSHSQAVRLAQQGRQRDDASCRRGPVKHWSMCLTRSNQAADYVVVAPLRPATLSAESFVTELVESRDVFLYELGLPLAGFAPLPFQPPRSQ